MVARTSPAKAPSGRADKRRRAILDAARDLFLEKGYIATTLADVVARSGGSLATIYELFGNKRRLFEVVLLEHANPVIESITVADGPREPEARLNMIARRYLEKVLDPDIVAWWRTMIAEAAHTPELRDIFLSKEGGAVVQSLAQYLQAQARAGSLQIADAERAAAQFFELVRGGLHRRALVGDTTMPSATEMEAQVRAAVHVFLHGYAVDPRRAPRRRTSRRHP